MGTAVDMDKVERVVTYREIEIVMAISESLWNCSLGAVYLFRSRIFVRRYRCLGDDRGDGKREDLLGRGSVSLLLFPLGRSLKGRIRRLRCLREEVSRAASFA